jgi:hypothetical protein
MRVMPLAADSLGVRSMATYVEAGDLRLLLDPGASLSPHRYGLPPTPDEEGSGSSALGRIEGYARRPPWSRSATTTATTTGPTSTCTRGVGCGRTPGGWWTRHQGRRGQALWRTSPPHCLVEAAEGRATEVGGVRLKLVARSPTAGGSGFGFGRGDRRRRDPLRPRGRRPGAGLDRRHRVHPARAPGPLYLSGPRPTSTRVGKDVVPGTREPAPDHRRDRLPGHLDHHAVRDRRYRERLGPAFETAGSSPRPSTSGVATSAWSVPARGLGAPSAAPGAGSVERRI